ncbi:hypothetical protein VPHG_00062 [Vibrio phage 11895-B1]|uniref:hypothetical protein n=1 Tax=Vibrio phage 11895-B1 TaxID=754075 RepID=UPI0002C051B2|nr:hypothetical protein VPHG_00062 [Vibrio phage 11895-B1]AGH32129.1 hypothetical protein VPHG_00062 [Vibrio phage 11895-B1]
MAYPVTHYFVLQLISLGKNEDGEVYEVIQDIETSGDLHDLLARRDQLNKDKIGQGYYAVCQIDLPPKNYFK